MATFVNPTVQRRVMRELAQLRNDPPEGIRVVTDEDNVLNIVGIIAGPENTPYEGGYFRVRFSFTNDFPAAPPKCWFATKIFHPNVSKSGEICVNTLKKDWKPTYGIAHILVTIKCLLIFPNPESALDEEAGKLLLEGYEDFCSRARIITSVHATPKTRPPEFDEPVKEKKEEKEASSSASTSTSAAPTRPSPAPAEADTENLTSVPITNRVPSTGNPLQPSTNAATTGTTVKPTGTKRPATSAIDKRKKALKRL
ncbi:hypothetical protein EXIGLDRAFT_723837 [Exidia glandulosa HHB12029]|uniref:E2 ubiquitin-conjugating enzyme n=1 Tax=Exidia glandulosa HHB12029 TaxID=1314781 RepID=A0A165EMQ2_EXIGL|nr:hypothetical protein EXIGLDRAFT_723837 [Exidia glandulosa HHB12029]